MKIIDLEKMMMEAMGVEAECVVKHSGENWILTKTTSGSYFLRDILQMWETRISKRFALELISNNIT